MKALDQNYLNEIENGKRSLKIGKRLSYSIENKKPFVISLSHV